MLPTSSPRTLSRMADIGNDIGKVTNMKKYMNHVLLAPTRSAYLEHAA